MTNSIESITMNTINLIGYASGIAANDKQCGLGPQYLLEHHKIFTDLNLIPEWKYMEYLESSRRGLDVWSDISVTLKKLAQDVMQVVSQPTPFAVIGGDHSMAIATWHSIMAYYQSMGSIGLLWIDAHLDSNTPQSSLSKNVHGMPVSHLLGLWDNPLLNFDFLPKTLLKPENLCLVGIRSYESPEYEYLKKRGVRIFFMEDIEKRGLDKVLSEAFDYLYQLTDNIGMSIDLDAFDPRFCPGVGCRESNGIDFPAFIKFFNEFYYKDWIALEIAEFNPVRDECDKTAKSIAELIRAAYF